MDPALIEGIVKLGAMGVLAGILLFVFIKYIPKRDREMREDRAEDRRLMLKMQEECHHTQTRNQAEFVKALQSALDSISRIRDAVDENTKATRDQTKALREQ